MGSRTRVCAAAVAAGVVAVIVPSAALASSPRPGTTERVSVTSDGTEGNAHSTRAAVSRDGRYVAFESDASNLVPDDTNNASDIFVHDRQTGVTERVSVASDGTQANGPSSSPAISADGRHVAFHSGASNLVPDDANGAPDVFVHDRDAGVTERVSVASDGTEAIEGSSQASISADGRYVSFWSSAWNLVEGDTNGRSDVFVHDRDTGETERVSVASDGTEADSHSFYSSVSADGRYVAFDSMATNLVPDDTNGTTDVFVRDRQTGVTERVSVASDGTQGDGISEVPVISADGRQVGFYSAASNLVPGQQPRTGPCSPVCFPWDVFVRDRETGTTERVSVASDGTQGNNGSSNFSMSADARYFAFYSFASNLVPGDTNNAPDVFLHDREAGTTERVSVATDGAQGNDWSFGPSVSDGGRFVAFYSRASNLVPDDTNNVLDVFVRDRGPGTGVGDLSVVVEGDRLAVSGWATFSEQTITTAADPPDDGAAGAEEAGGELTGARVVYRPQQDDLLVRLQLASLRGERCVGVVCEDGGGAVGVLAPGLVHRRVLYDMSFTFDDALYVARARSGSAVRAPAVEESDEPVFTLYRCEPDCEEQASLTGGIGTTGAEVWIAVPLATVGAAEGTGLTQLRASTAREETALQAEEPLDDMELPDATIPTAAVSLGIAPAGTPEEEVSFDTDALLFEGAFSGSLDVAALPPGDYDVWARACLGEVCGAASTPVTVA